MHVASHDLHTLRSVVHGHYTCTTQMWATKYTQNQPLASICGVVIGGAHQFRRRMRQARRLLPTRVGGGRRTRKLHNPVPLVTPDQLAAETRLDTHYWTYCSAPGGAWAPFRTPSVVDCHAAAVLNCQLHWCSRTSGRLPTGAAQAVLMNQTEIGDDRHSFGQPRPSGN